MEYKIEVKHENNKRNMGLSPMIISLVKRDLRGRYKGSALGFLWTF